MKQKYELPEYYPWKDAYKAMLRSAKKIIKKRKKSLEK